MRWVTPQSSSTTRRPSSSTSSALPSRSPYGSLHQHPLPDGGEVLSIQLVDVARERVVRSQQGERNVVRLELCTEAGRALGCPTNVEADPHHHRPAHRALRQNASQLATVDEHIVRPLQLGFDTSDFGNCCDRCQADAACQFTGVSRHLTEQQRHQHVRTGRSVPCAIQTAPPCGLMVGTKHRSVGRTQVDLGQQVGIGAAGFRDVTNVPTGRAVSGIRCRFRRGNGLNRS